MIKHASMSRGSILCLASRFVVQLTMMKSATDLLSNVSPEWVFLSSPSVHTKMCIVPQNKSIFLIMCRFQSTFQLFCLKKSIWRQQVVATLPAKAMG